MAVVSSCREMLGLSPATSATPVNCCQHIMVGTLFRLPRLNWEEGGDDVKSVWPLRPGLHTCYNAQYNVNRDREGGGNPAKLGSVRIGGCNSPP